MEVEYAEILDFILATVRLACKVSENIQVVEQPNGNIFAIGEFRDCNLNYVKENTLRVPIDRAGCSGRGLKRSEWMTRRIVGTCGKYGLGFFYKLIWCKGSTTGFEPVGSGSIPFVSAKRGELLDGLVETHRANIA